MKGPMLCLFVLASNLLSPVAAYGVRGGVERILYFAAYRCEEYGPAEGGHQRFTVATLCSGSRPGGRCTFNEFLSFIWAPDESIGDTERPTVRIFNDAKFDFTKAKIQTMLQKMNGWNKAGLKHPITGNIDHDRLFPGSSDFYDALSKVGGPVSYAKGIADSLEPENGEKAPLMALINKATDAANAAVDLRVKDLDNSPKKPRLGWLNRWLGFEVSTKPGRNSATIAGVYKVFDAVQTVKDHPGNEMNIVRAWVAWLEDTSGNNSNLRHFRAYTSARAAARACGC